MKTGQEFLDELPEPAKGFAIKAMKSQGKYERVEASFRDMNNFISSAFTWADTPQGKSYWAKICHGETTGAEPFNEQ